MDTYIKLKDACLALGISKCTFYKLLDQNILPFVKVGYKVRVNRADVEALSKDGWSWNVT